LQGIKDISIDFDFERLKEYLDLDYAHIEAGKVNFNWWPKLPDETVEDYMRRLHKFAG
jgi:hypothetical protein